MSDEEADYEAGMFNRDRPGCVVMLGALVGVVITLVAIIVGGVVALAKLNGL